MFDIGKRATSETFFYTVLIRLRSLQLLSIHFYFVSQAIDLRLMDVKFQAGVKSLLSDTISGHLSTYLDKRR